MVGLPRVSWVEDQPDIVAREKAAMHDRCPEITWRDDLAYPDGRRARGWMGYAPRWGAERPEPAGVANLVGDKRLRLAVLYPEAFPMVAPDLYPLEPEVPIEYRTMQQWHVNGDGSLCMMQAAADWQPEHTAAELVAKAAGWFIEYLLMQAGDLDAMTIEGLYANTEIDDLLTRHA